jgi:hypothetical protein
MQAHEQQTRWLISERDAVPLPRSELAQVSATVSDDKLSQTHPDPTDQQVRFFLALGVWPFQGSRMGRASDVR